MRLSQMNDHLAMLSDIAEEYELLRIQVDRLKDTMERSSRRDRETIEAKLTDLERSLESSIDSLRRDIKSLRSGEGGQTRGGAGGSLGGREARNLLQGLPEINEAMLSQVMGALGSALGLDDEQSSRVEEVIRKRVREVNALRTEVASGERDVNDAMAKAEEILDQVIEELDPILDDMQSQMLEQLVESIGMQIQGYM